MPELAIQFMRGNPGVITDAIRRALPLSPDLGGFDKTPAHCRILDRGSQRVIEAVIGGVQQVCRDDSGLLCTAFLACDYRHYDAAIDFAFRQVGKPYDFYALVLDMVWLACGRSRYIHLRDNDRVRWDCSRLCEAAAWRAGRRYRLGFDAPAMPVTLLEELMADPCVRVVWK